jgi:ion channel-forming bestrophin family protein
VIVAGVAGWLPLLRRIGPMAAALFAYDLAVTILNLRFGLLSLSAGELPLPLLGSALGVFMGLRNSLAYNRWWEARTLWGAAVNHSRSLVRGLLWMLPDDARTRTIAHLQIAWAHALRCRLRHQEPWDEIAPLLEAAVMARIRQATNTPTALQTEQVRIVGLATQDRSIDTIQAAAIDRVMSKIAEAQGGLERISNTPLPRHFDHFPLFFVIAYCVLLPVGMVGELGGFTPLGATFLGLIFLALDRIGRDLESPFANTEHDVPLSAITRTIEIDLREMLGEENVPKPLAPVRNVLW